MIRTKANLGMLVQPLYSMLFIDGQKLTFKKKGDIFQDQQTNSTWDITGRSRAGPLEEKQLQVEPHSNHLAFA